MPDSLMKRSAAELVEDVVISVLVDASSSMRKVQDATIAAYNAFIEDRRADPAVRYGCVLFNTYYTPLVTHTTHDAIRFSRAVYRPDGGTYLYSSIIRRINDIERMPIPPSEVLFVVFSDGDDNEPDPCALDAAKRAIANKRELGWRFVFFAPDDSTRAAATRLGFPQDNIADYRGDSRGISAAFQRLSRGTRQFIAATEQYMLPPGRFFEGDT